MVMETPTRESVISALQSNNPDVLQRALRQIKELSKDDRQVCFFEISRRMDNNRFFMAFSRAVIIFYLEQEVIG